MENAGPAGAAIGNTGGSFNSNSSNELNHEKYGGKMHPAEEREGVIV